MVLLRFEQTVWNFDHCIEDSLYNFVLEVSVRQVGLEDRLENPWHRHAVVDVELVEASIRVDLVPPRSCWIDLDMVALIPDFPTPVLEVWDARKSSLSGIASLLPKWLRNVEKVEVVEVVQG